MVCDAVSAIAYSGLSLNRRHKLRAHFWCRRCAMHSSRLCQRSADAASVKMWTIFSALASERDSDAQLSGRVAFGIAWRGFRRVCVLYVRVCAASSNSDSTNALAA